MLAVGAGTVTEVGDVTGAVAAVGAASGESTGAVAAVGDAIGTAIGDASGASIGAVAAVGDATGAVIGVVAAVGAATGVSSIFAEHSRSGPLEVVGTLSREVGMMTSPKLTLKSSHQSEIDPPRISKILELSGNSTR